MRKRDVCLYRSIVKIVLYLAVFLLACLSPDVDVSRLIELGRFFGGRI